MPKRHRPMLVAIVFALTGALLRCAPPAPATIPGTSLDVPYLRQASADIIAAIKLGAADINNSASSCTPDRFGFGYLAQGWRQSASLEDLADDPVLTLKFLVSLGAFRETTGIFYPALQEQEVIFPALDGLALPRMALTQVPAMPVQDDPAIAPRGLAIHPGTELTIIGLITTADSAPPRALVAISDPQRAGWLTMRHFLALLPLTDGAGDRLTLDQLVSLNGGRCDAASGVLFLPQTEGEVAVKLNPITGDALVEALHAAVGLAFVDRLDGASLDEPLVPYPPGIDLPVSWALMPDPAGDPLTLILQDHTTQAVLVQARYDRRTLSWVWLPATVIESTP